MGDDTGLSPHEFCPVCQGEYVMRCRCPISNMRCASGHDWHLCPVHGTVNLGTGHGKGGQCTCERGGDEAPR